MSEPTLRQRLLDELDRGADADLAKLFRQLGVLAEPSPEVDAHILAAVPGADAPPARVDQAVLAAAAAAARPRRIRRTVTYVSSALAMAAALVGAFGLGRRTATPGLDVNGEVASTVLQLSRDVLAREGPEAAARTLAPSGLPPRWDEWQKIPHVDASRPDSERYAQIVLAYTDNLRESGDTRLVAPLETTLVKARARCPEHSRCDGLLSLRLAELAFADQRPADGAAYLQDAALSDDTEIRARAAELASRQPPSPAPR